jgi:uncharacterized protein (DUF433 family)
MIGSELALTKTIVDIFAMEDPYDESSSLSRVVELLAQLDEAEAQVFGAAYGRAMDVLSVDLPRWREAADIAIRLDLPEVISSFANQIKDHPDPHQIASFVSLAQSPAVSNQSKRFADDLIESFRGVLPLRRLLEIRNDPTISANTDLEAAISVQMWPGKYATAQLARTAPIVYLAESGASLNQILALAGMFVMAGARIRRIPDSWMPEAAHREWFSSDFPIIAWSGSAVAGLRSHFRNFPAKTVMAPHDIGTPLVTARLLARVDDLLRPLHSLRRTEQFGQELPAFAPETLKLGAFDSAEMAYLGAASRSVIQRVSKQSLRPIDADVNRWNFEQLVALRVYQAFKLTGRHFQGDPAMIQTRLSEIASANESHRVGMDSAGVVYVEDSTGFRALHNNQLPIEDILTMDDAFRPIILGGGNYPDLLRPAKYVSVHPATLAGTPVISGRRVSARAIATLALVQGNDVVRSAYPELRAPEVADAIRVGNGIQASVA